MVSDRKFSPMPNIKVYIDEDIFAAHKTAVTQTLVPLRDSVVRHLGAPQSACQVALVPVVALKDQPTANIEMHIMPHPDRTREVITAMGAEIQTILRDVIGAPIAFRCVQLDPATYVALK
jgi:hypothetical protein